MMLKLKAFISAMPQVMLATLQFSTSLKKKLKCTAVAGIHDRNARTVPVNGCLHTAQIDREGAHFTHATR